MSLIREMKRRVDAAMNKVAREIVRRGLYAGDVGGDYVAQVEGDAGDVKNRHETWQHFGVASRAPAGGEVALVAFGSGEGAVAIAENDRAHRPSDLGVGDAVVYAKKDGTDQAQLRVEADGNVRMLAPKSGAFAQVGGDDEFLLLGNSHNADLSAFLAAITGDVGFVAAHPAVSTAAGVLSGKLASHLATKGKVK